MTHRDKRQAEVARSRRRGLRAGRLVPFSCNARRMAEVGAFLIDQSSRNPRSASG